MTSQLPIVAEAGLLMNTLTSRISLGVALGLALTSQASAFTPDVIHRTAETDGARLEVTLRRDRQAVPAAVSLEVAVTNTFDRRVLLPGGAERYGLELVLRTEDGRIVRDNSPAPTTRPLPLDPGETRSVTVDLAKHPLYLAQQGFLEVIQPLDGIYDPKIADQAYLTLEVIQHGAEGSILSVEPLPVVLVDPILLGKRNRFAQLHAEAPAAPGTMVWDPTMPVTPPAQYEPGVVIVGFHQHVELDVARYHVVELGYRVSNISLFTDELKILVIAVPEGEEAAAAAELRHLEDVAYADLDWYSRIM